MFLGHYAMGFAAKSWTGRVSLGTMFLAAVWLDLIWSPLLLLGKEVVTIEAGHTVVSPLQFEHFPLSHSLFMALVWGALIGLGVFALHRSTRGALLVWGAVLSHWMLDFITHRPELPLFVDNEIKVGLGLWNSLWGTLALEGGLFVLGLTLYLSATRARNKIGIFALWGLVLSLVALAIGNYFGPPPPDAMTVAWAGNAQWLLVLWAYWVDRHRMPKDHKGQAIRVNLRSRPGSVGVGAGEGAPAKVS